jgi:hypothetical protein
VTPYNKTASTRIKKMAMATQNQIPTRNSEHITNTTKYLQTRQTTREIHVENNFKKYEA